MQIDYMERMVAEARKRRDKIAAMKRKGISLADIGKLLGVSRQRVHAILKKR